MTRPEVVVVVAQGCHLCDVALEVVRAVRAELDFPLRVVGIDGDPDLEARYRLDIPVVEIGGERAFYHDVPPDALRERLQASGAV